MPLEQLWDSVSKGWNAWGRLPVANASGGIGIPRPRPRIGSLPPEARVPSQYPDGVWTGIIGGGNAGASIQPALGPTRPPAPPEPPGSRNVPIVNGPGRARNAALSRAAQQAGLPAWNWQADENAAMRRAAEDAGRAAAAARQGGGYISGDALPATSDPGQQAYWERADIQAWAKANPALAKRLQEREGFQPGASAAGAPRAMTSSDAILLAQGAGALDSLRPGATTSDAILAGQAAGAFDRGLAGAAPAAAPAAAQSPWTTGQAILRAQGAGALDNLRPGATSSDAILAGQAAGAFDGPVAQQVAPRAMDPTSRVAPAQALAPSMAEGDDPAQELNRRYLNAIRIHGMGLG